MLKKLALITTSLFLLAACKTLDVQKAINAIDSLQPQALTEETVIQGLKEALNKGTNESVVQTNRKGGFSDNPMIRIPVPEQLDKVANAVTKIGLGRYVEAFEVKMNRAAESATKEARVVFISAISQMSINDAWNILKGADNAATQFFRQRSEAELTQRFAPIVTNHMKKVGFYGDYKRLLNSYEKIPFTQKPDLDIERYIVNKTLDGLFLLVAEEEKKIRTNPAKRTTELLKKVFAAQ
jgi:hypothetical protein